MTTQLFFLENDNSISRFAIGDNGTQEAGWKTILGANSGWGNRYLDIVRGNAAQTAAANTVTGPTDGVEIKTGVNLHWMSPPLTAAVTISGTITFNLWALESGMNANVAINALIERVGPTGDVVSTVVKTARTVEVGTSSTVNNFTATPTSTNFARGDRIRIRIFLDDAGTMATGFTGTFSYNANSAGVDGDSYVTFNETFTVATNIIPSGTKLWFTDVASDVATASVDKEAWTTAGSSIATAVRDTVAGWTAPLQITDTAGGTVIDWFTKPLQAVTVTTAVWALLYSSQSLTATNATHQIEIARVDGDGTNPLVWGASRVVITNTAAQTAAVFVAGTDLVLSNGQRLRFRLYVDDNGNSGAALVTGRTVTFHYNGTGGSESYLQFGETLAEYVAAAAVAPYSLFVGQAVTRAATR